MMPLESFPLSDLIGFIAAALVFLSFSMKAMLSLRLIALASNVAFITYAFHAELIPILVLHGALLPLNLFRLLSMWRDVKDFDRAENDEDFLSLAPLGERMRLRPGELLFRRDDFSDAMYVLIDGEIELVEIGLTVGRGALIGEIGLYSKDRRRTATARAVGDVRLSKINVEVTRKIFFDNPHLADRMARLITTRLVTRLQSMEMAAAERPARGKESPVGPLIAERRVALAGDRLAWRG